MQFLAWLITLSKFLKCYFSQVYFWFAYILSISTEIMYFKEFLFDRVKVGDVRSFIDLALTVITICTKICHLYTIVLNSPNTVPDGDLQLTKEDIGKDKWNLKVTSKLKKNI